MGSGVRIGIIGAGWVGASVAISTLHAGIAQELLLHDVRTDVAEGEAMDLSHGSAFYPSASVRTATLEDMGDASAIVVAAGRGGRPGESRLDLLKDNARVIRELGARFRGFHGTVIVVTNPVDVLTHQFADASQLPRERVLGTGTMLDTARLRNVLSRTLHVAPQSIHANVIGEHGDSEVVLWSSATVAGVPIAQWTGWTASVERRIADEVRTAAYEIIRRKGATNHAIGLVTAALLRSVVRGENRVLTVSRVQNGTLGIRDVAISLPTIVGSGGGADVIAPELDDRERAALLKSVNILSDAVHSLTASSARH
jgi:L-lactate dehydrogenase